MQLYTRQYFTKISGRRGGKQSGTSLVAVAGFARHCLAPPPAHSRPVSHAPCLLLCPPNAGPPGELVFRPAGPRPAPGAGNQRARAAPGARGAAGRRTVPARHRSGAYPRPGRLERAPGPARRRRQSGPPMALVAGSAACKSGQPAPYPALKTAPTGPWLRTAAPAAPRAAGAARTARRPGRAEAIGPGPGPSGWSPARGGRRSG